MNDWRFQVLYAYNYIGGPSESRTRDLLLARQVLSQLSYGPIKAGLLSIKHPIGSEFHIITHNGLIYLIVVGFIIVATLGVGVHRTYFSHLQPLPNCKI